MNPAHGFAETTLEPMPISMGIMCEKCGIVCLITAAAKNRIDRLPRSGDPDMFTLTCTGCAATRSFHKNDLKLYVVSAQDYARGYAKRGEYSVREDLTHVPPRKPRRE